VNSRVSASFALRGGALVAGVAGRSPEPPDARPQLPIRGTVVKLTIERAPLLKALNHLHGIVDRRQTIPILGNALMRADEGRLLLTTTDMDLGMSESIPAMVATEGTTTAPANTLYDIVRKLRDGAQVELELAKNDLALRSGRSRFTLPTIGADDYPVMRADDLQHLFSIPSADLRKLIDRTRFAISTEKTRHYLNGIYLHAAQDDGAERVLRAVATDGHRLALSDVPLPDGAAGMPGVIVPRKTVLELGKLIDDVEGDIATAVGKSKCTFAAGAWSATSKLIDGEFPEYRRVIPSGNNKVLEVARREFTEAVDRVATIITERSRAIRLSIDDGKINITAREVAAGSATEDIEGRYDAPAIEIGFNSRYLADIAGQIDGETLRIDLGDPGGPALIRDAADQSALYVLMPMRV